jgi:NADPH:quinone reductase-like Zn-dependent oxidoreductase
VIPTALGFADAAAIAAAGLAALYALERCGSLVGKKMLITAANGQVGRLACQIARAAGATVSGLVRTPTDADTAQGIDIITPNSLNERSRMYDYIIDMVGGDTLGLAAARLRAGGRCIVVGNASAATTTIDASELYMNQRELVGFALFPEIEVKPAEGGLPRVFALWEAGLLTVPPTNQLPAEDFSDPHTLDKAKTVLMFG